MERVCVNRLFVDCLGYMSFRGLSTFIRVWRDLCMECLYRFNRVGGVILRDYYSI